MNSSELLSQINKKDRRAFIELMNNYGGDLYRRILSKVGDKNLADSVFREVLLGMYDALTYDGSADAAEALLNRYADWVCENELKNSVSEVIADISQEVLSQQNMLSQNNVNKECPKAQVPEKFENDADNKTPVRNDTVHQQPTKKSVHKSPAENAVKANMPARPGNLWFGLGVSSLSICILAAIWVILGLMMNMNLIPDLDLGYTWFNTNVAPWF